MKIWTVCSSIPGLWNALSSIRFSSFVDADSLKGQAEPQAAALIEGALRLAALFHDLGHLPFSHDGEYALQDFAPAGEAAGKSLPTSSSEIANVKAPHEEIGHALAYIVLRLLPESGMAFAMCIHSHADSQYDRTRLWTIQASTDSALQWLHSLS